MRVVVTGGAGYVGSRVSAHLLESGWEVIILDRLYFGGEGILPLLDHPHLQLFAGDIRDEDVLQAACKGADCLVHLAALVGEPACLVDPDASREINLRGSELVLKSARDAGIKRVLFVSTCSNYGVANSGVLANEDSPLLPLSLYAETKIQAEQVILEANDDDFSACVLRLGTICGLSPRMRFNLLVNEIARNAALGKAISIYGQKAWRPFLHIRDAAEVIRFCLDAPAASLRGEVFNVVGENYQKEALARLALKHFPQTRVSVQEISSDPRDYRVCGERIAHRLGYRPARTVEDAFLEVARAVRDGLFQDPNRAIYEALPASKFLREKEYLH